VTCASDQDSALGAEDSLALGQDQLDQRRVLVQPGRQLLRLGARLDVGQPAHPALALRDRFLGDDDDVARLQCRPLGDQLAERVSCAELGQAGDREDPQLPCG
jgi:hypothetical protein